MELFKYVPIAVSPYVPFHQSLGHLKNINTIDKYMLIFKWKTFTKAFLSEVINFSEKHKYRTISFFTTIKKTITEMYIVITSKAEEV